MDTVNNVQKTCSCAAASGNQSAASISDSQRLLFAQLLAQSMDSSLASLADFSESDSDNKRSNGGSSSSLLSSLAGLFAGGTQTTAISGPFGNFSTAGPVGQTAAQAALTRVGDPYSQARRGTGNYVDCSSFTQWSYGQAGVTLPGTAAEQAQYCAQNGYTIARGDLQEGDLVFWSKAGCDCGRYDEIHHVGIYLGDGKVVEASSSKGQVVVNDLWGENGGKWQVAMYARPY
ncbi:C40 family peptidase [Christensenella hongkongensis]|uniref:NLP/P60 family protein n=1 Tax=Christensenella hongkongensis TaxID=270498 RepID=A0A0M2NII5_9FIRM|nr:C40 family peptidase [Christensenella hongkongensis]KKI50247.1 NLP/P60 family protein [Christensenella hongkongensis]TCW31114.1 cell wall-associated NlpC family hydrolase [Christensenella hongkongensis]